MKTSIQTEEAYRIFDKYLKTPYLRFHVMESEAVMRRIAMHLGEDADFYGITGLLHDLDMDLINERWEIHGLHTVELLKAEGYDIPVMFDAIVSHTEGVPGSMAERKTRFEFILAGAENITGLISAYVAVKPDKKIEGTGVSSIVKRFKSPAFAAKVNRRFIQDVTDVAGIPQDIFFDLAIKGFMDIAPKINM